MPKIKYYPIYLLDSATVAQSGRASASRADVQPDVRVQILNQDESPGGGVFKTFLADTAAPATPIFQLHPSFPEIRPFQEL